MLKDLLLMVNIKMDIIATYVKKDLLLINLNLASNVSLIFAYNVTRNTVFRTQLKQPIRTTSILQTYKYKKEVNVVIVTKKSLRAFK
jgi:hypothetical protein